MECLPSNLAIGWQAGNQNIRGGATIRLKHKSLVSLIVRQGVMRGPVRTGRLEPVLHVCLHSALFNHTGDDHAMFPSACSTRR